MGILNRIFGSGESVPRDRAEPVFQAASPENPSTPLSNPDSWLLDWAGAGGQTFGPPISERTAMSVSAVFRCVSILSGLQASLPLKIYKRQRGAARVEAPDHRLADFLRVEPYPGRAMTAYTWREMWGVNVQLWGNHVSIIRYDGAARVVGFEPVMPWGVQVVQRAGRNLYRCTLTDKSVEWHDQEDILHIPGIGFDGVQGLSRIQAFSRDSIALAKLLTEQAGRIHENSARPSGMIGLPANISPEGKKRMEEWMTANYFGRANAGKPLFVDNDTKFTPFQMPPADLNTLELLRFQVADICRFFGVPPHLVGETANTSAWGSGIEQNTLAFLRYTLDPELQRTEHELNLKLFVGSDYYCEFDRDALLTMDAKTAAEVSQTRINSGTLTINEDRRRRNLADVEGGDEPMVNSTMVSLKRALTGPAAPPPPAAKDPANA